MSSPLLLTKLASACDTDGMCNEPEMSESESGYSHPTDYHSSEVGPTGTMHDHQMSASLSQIDSWLTGHNTTHSHKSSFASSSGGYQYREHDKELGTEYMSQRYERCGRRWMLMCSSCTNSAICCKTKTQGLGGVQFLSDELSEVSRNRQLTVQFLRALSLIHI